MENFKNIEPVDYCPPHIQRELVSEIDSIRNSLQVVQLYAGDFFGVVASLLKFDSPETQPFTHE